jgi:hypothetical protein
MSGLVPWTGGGGYLPSLVTTVPTNSIPQNTASLREWWKELQKEVAPQESRMQSAVVGIRHNGESAAMGAILAFIDTDLGGLDLGGRIPIDWIAAALFYALSIRDTGKEEGIASDFRALGQSCTTVAMYRMVQRWRAGRKVIPGNTKTPKDPVLAAGKTATF